MAPTAPMNVAADSLATDAALADVPSQPAAPIRPNPDPNCIHSNSIDPNSIDLALTAALTRFDLEDALKGMYFFG